MIDKVFTISEASKISEKFDLHCDEQGYEYIYSRIIRNRDGYSVTTGSKYKSYEEKVFFSNLLQSFG